MARDIRPPQDHAALLRDKGPLAVLADWAPTDMADAGLDRRHVVRLAAKTTLADDCDDEGYVPLRRFNLFLRTCGFRNLEVGAIHVRRLVQRCLLRCKEMPTRPSDRSPHGYALAMLWGEVTLTATPLELAELEPLIPFV